MLCYTMFFLLIICLAEASNMNKGGVPYAISNPPGSTSNWQGTPGDYSTEFETNVHGNVEHFDVYGEVHTLYSQVYWTRNTPIDLPPELVARFRGKVMAITGYEIDQVTHSGPQVGSTTTERGLGGFSCYPDCGESDQSVPIYHAYNHHYFSWLTGSESEMYRLDEPLFLPNPTVTGFRTKNGTNHSFPTNIVFKENPGGEYRKSYHGYPAGFAQLIHPPSQWVVEPMQIDTHNRNYSITDQAGYKQSFLPKRFQNNMTNLGSGLSPLIECPCSDRITKTTVISASLQTVDVCKLPIATEADCVAAITETGVHVINSSTVKDPILPPGCIMKPDHGLSYLAIFNKENSSSTCGNSQNVALQGSAVMDERVEIHLEHDTIRMNINISGPVNVWFGVGFGASTMKDKPYAIIVDGNGMVTERKLGDHSPGNLLSPSIKVLHVSIKDGIRTVLLERMVNGPTADHLIFPSSPGDLDLIAAIGGSSQLSYHKSRTGGKITLLPTKANACVCQPHSKPFITYMDTNTGEFGVYNCIDAPRSDMAHKGDGTGRDVPNQACQMETYHGGLQCCKHSWFLTDRDQDSLISKDKQDKYFLKWRYYFQEYKPSTSLAPASHKHLHHWVFLIDAQVNDYEEDNVEYGKESIGKISAHLKASEIGLEDLHSPTDDGAPPVPNNYTTIKSLVITPHCHAPSCIRQELWNSDRGEIICNMTAKYGDEKYGSTNNIFNEKDYLTILPCIYGYQPGLQTPFNLRADTNITAIKYFNNTHRHLGQMAQWTGLMVYDTDPY